MSLFSESDIAFFRADRLALMAAQYLAGLTITDTYLLNKLRAAEAETMRDLRVRFQPTTFFAGGGQGVPTPAQITALGDKALWDVEPGYDYSPSFFQGDNWGYLITRQKPILSVASVTFVYPNPTNAVFAIPNDWLRIDQKYGHIRMVPASSQFIAPLGAFIMQALGGGTTIPSMIQMTYRAGLDAPVKDGGQLPFSIDSYPDLINVIRKRAILDIIKDCFVPSSTSISADGLSQSIGLKMADYEDEIDRKLFGGKGSNGGLKTAIHGVIGSVLGMIA